jgi:hypothetical protein
MRTVLLTTLLLVAACGKPQSPSPQSAASFCEEVADMEDAGWREARSQWAVEPIAPREVRIAGCEKCYREDKPAGWKRPEECLEQDRMINENASSGTAGSR